MLRTITAVFVAITLQLAVVGAPLFHAHLDDDHDGHHRAARVHAHLGGHAHHALHHDGPAVAQNEDSERAIGLQLFVAVQPAAFSVPALPQLRFTLAAPLESIVLSPSGALHSHDPPLRQSGPSRAPPPFLS